MPALGIDIGATRTKLALVGARGRVLRRARIATNAERGPEALLHRVAAWTARAPRIDRAGAGFAGMVDARGGVVVATTDTMPGFAGLTLARSLRDRLGVPARCDNDGNCAALGETLFGAGRGARSVAMLTLGTGVGGGLVLDGRIVRGAGGMAGKLGHIKVRRGGHRCACGARGCLEAHLSAWAFARIDGREPRALFRAARAGERRAARIVNDAADALGTALSDIANVINPDVIVIGGGMAPAMSQLAPRALARYEALALPRAHATTRVVRAKLGAWSGAVGAAALRC